ncbi:MAG TPA: hypothetical protein VNQ79_15115 [Blastocatellia bacterium]|nr:hypothetical protein [Blastocatellia bacterium]
MSVYDSRDLMTFKGAAREYDLPVATLEMAVASGVLRLIDDRGERKLLRPDVEQFVKRTIKRGLGNKVVSRINPAQVESR